MALTLAHLDHPPGEAPVEPPLLIAHGLFGQGRNFNSIAKQLATTRRVVAVDMRNHGTSPWDARMDYPVMAEDLAETVRTLCGGRAVVLGHSMGGKAAMALALTAPDLLAGLIVADIAPVAYAHSHADMVAAMRALDLSAVRRRSDADRMLAAEITAPSLRAFVLQSLDVKEGTARWRLNLDALATGMQSLLDFPADLPMRQFEGPSHFLYGGASDYVGSERQGPIRTLFPAATFEVVEGAGHWLHAERPDAFVERVDAWLQTL